jgi:hypothetical protein
MSYPLGIKYLICVSSPTDIKFDRLIIAFGNSRKLESPGKFLRLSAILGRRREFFWQQVFYRFSFHDIPFIITNHASFCRFYLWRTCGEFPQRLHCPHPQGRIDCAAAVALSKLQVANFFLR